MPREPLIPFFRVFVRAISKRLCEAVENPLSGGRREFERSGKCRERHAMRSPLETAVAAPIFEQKTRNREYRRWNISLVVGGSVTAFLAVRSPEPHDRRNLHASQPTAPWLRRFFIPPGDRISNPGGNITRCHPINVLPEGHAREYFRTLVRDLTSLPMEDHCFGRCRERNIPGTGPARCFGCAVSAPTLKEKLPNSRPASPPRYRN